MDRQFYGGYGYIRNTFEQMYRCYPPSVINKPHLEIGDKIIMPPSALDSLASMHISYPMLFQLQSTSAGRVSHCGVLEFTADEGSVFIALWLMQNLDLEDGEIVIIKNAELPKGNYIKLQPHTKDFLDISNPKAILENTLRDFSCLTSGGSIVIAYNNKNYCIDVVETKPASAVSIIETDCEVDFAPPLDYKEPEPPKTPVPAAQVEEIPEEAKLTFTPFTGSGRRLDGKPVTMNSNPSVVGASTNRPAQEHSGGKLPSSSASQNTSSSSQRPSGKLVFGSSSAPKEIKKAPAKKPEEAPKKEGPKFQAFNGKKYSLMG